MGEPVGPGSVTIDELLDTPASPNLAEVRLDGDSVPETLRGKTAADAMTRIGQMEDALRVSESARLQAEATARAAMAQPPDRPAAPVEPDGPKELTNEELAVMHQEDPIAAITYMSERASRTAQRNLEARIGPLFTSSGANMEAQMRAKYPTEFELFGSDIMKLAESVPNKQVVLSNPAAWDDMIALIRGRAGNLDKFVAKRSGQPAPLPPRVAAQVAEAQNVGFQATGASAGRSGRLASEDQMDDIQIDIADKMGLSRAEYMKWYNVGQRGV